MTVERVALHDPRAQAQRVQVPLRERRHVPIALHPAGEPGPGDGGGEGEGDAGAGTEVQEPLPGGEAQGLERLDGGGGEGGHGRHVAAGHRTTTEAVERFTVALEQDRLVAVDQIEPLRPVVGVGSVEQMPVDRIRAGAAHPAVGMGEEHLTAHPEESGTQTGVGQDTVGLQTVDHGGTPTGCHGVEVKGQGRRPFQCAGKGRAGEGRGGRAGKLRVGKGGAVSARSGR